MKRVLITAAGVAVAIAGAVVWLHAAPTIGPVTATPAYIVVNAPTPVVIAVQVIDTSLIAGSVNLLKVDSSGKTLATVGVMRDDGLNGDVANGDKTFSYRLTINQPSVGQASFRVSAAFKGVLQRSLSNVVAVTVDPVTLPPDPGEAGKQTLAGIDSDHDGVRDDVQRQIGYQIQISSTQRAALTQYGAALQLTITGNSGTVSNSGVAAIRCIASTFGVQGMPGQVAFLRKAMLDTPDRVRAYLLVKDNSPSSTAAPAPGDLTDSCIR